jgi:DNA-binding response OmpR family regulator
VETVHDGNAAYHQLLAGSGYDVALLDWMLPGMDGATVARRLRGLGLAVPILMLTARSDVRDRIDGLDAGADDYLPKPFDLDELLARLRALYRRSSLAGEAPIRVGDLVVDPVARRVTRAGEEIALSAREFDILHLLAASAGQVVTRFTILDQVWDGETDLRSNVIDVHLAAIRAKIDRPFGTDTITTLRGVGYRLDAPAATR